MTEPALAACHLCHHAWPTQRLCRACSPRCVACLHNLLQVYASLEVAAHAVIEAWDERQNMLYYADEYCDRLTVLRHALAALDPQTTPGEGETSAGA